MLPSTRNQQSSLPLHVTLKSGNISGITGVARDWVEGTKTPMCLCSLRHVRRQDELHLDVQTTPLEKGLYSTGFDTKMMSGGY